MRHLRVSIVAAVAAASFLVPATAVAQINSISVTGGQLVAQGASVALQVTVQCDPGYNLAFIDANVTQVSGHKLAQGQGFFGANYPGVPCGTPTNVTVNASGSVAFKNGNATATVNVTVFNPTTFSFASQTSTQTIRLTK